MSKIGVIILSDIHFIKDESKCKLCLKEPNYLTTFLTFIKQQMIDDDIKYKYMLIAGDLVESGKRSEYKEVKEVLNKILKELEIKKEHLLLVPGNHDLSRDQISSYCDTNDIPEDKAFQYMDIKFQNYIEFYKEFMGVNVYSLNKAIISTLNFEECNISVLGVNSNAKESHRREDHIGYIDEDKLMEEIKDLDTNRHYLVLTHHSWSDDRQSELPTIKNAESAKKIFQLKNITAFMYGHHHALDRKKVEDKKGVYQYYEIGSFSKVLSGGSSDSYNNVFVTAVIDEKDLKLQLKNYIYFQNDWTSIPDGTLNEIVFKQKAYQQIQGKTEFSDEFMMNPQDNMLEHSSGEQDYFDQDNLTIGEESEKYLNYIAENRLYREGHYHWSNGENTRGWINISFFLGNHIILSNLRKDFKNFYAMLFEKEYIDKIDAVIGYGMEGNIVGSSLVPFFLKNDIRYIFYPSVHKGKNYINAEKITWNQATQVENIIFIFDFIPSNEYIQEIIKSGEIFENVKKLFIFSIFSIKEKENVSSTIIINRMEENGNNKEEQNILAKYYAACRLSIPKCELDMTKCPICINNLAEVIKV